MKLGNTRLELIFRSIYYLVNTNNGYFLTLQTIFFSLTLMKWSSLFQVGEGWINLGQAIPPTDGREQFAIYMLDNPTLPAYTSLNRCAF